MKRYCYFDFETTGLDPRHHEPIELAAIMLDEDLNEVARFPARIMSVLRPEFIEDSALRINNKTREQIAGGEEPQKVLNDFIDWVTQNSDGSKVMLSGHNVKFDIDFLKAMFNLFPTFGRNYDDLFDYHSMCTANLVLFHYVLTTKTLKKCSLTSITAHLGIEHKAHEAMGDVEAGVQVLRILASKFKS